MIASMTGDWFSTQMLTLLVRRCIHVALMGIVNDVLIDTGFHHATFVRAASGLRQRTFEVTFDQDRKKCTTLARKKREFLRERKSVVSAFYLCSDLVPALSCLQVEDLTHFEKIMDLFININLV